MTNAERAAVLERYRERAAGLATAPTIGYAKLADRDEGYLLRGPPLS